jgi:hypothetical protein
MEVTNKVKLPKVKCRLVGTDGNAFALMGRFRRAADAAGWTRDDLNRVLDEAMSGDYTKLLRVLGDHCENGGF